MLWTARLEYLHAAMHAIDSEFGGLERYFHQQLGLTPAVRDELADRLLEPAA